MLSHALVRPALLLLHATYTITLLRTDIAAAVLYTTTHEKYTEMRSRHSNICKRNSSPQQQ